MSSICALLTVRKHEIVEGEADIDPSADTARSVESAGFFSARKSLKTRQKHNKFTEGIRDPICVNEI